ncbi:MAG: Rieske 2Fe-2S domain-containing protein [Betaproteobacteria bacterium]|nr:Rieske 2Fe-2S domain-containing protein [Betaproteobacteria bacterium]
MFVQRLSQTSGAFENVCVHPSCPLLKWPRGNGAMVCGFHHWKQPERPRA